MTGLCSHGTNCTRQPCAHINGTCACRSDRAARRETTDVLTAMTDTEKQAVLNWLLYHNLDHLREGINETEGDR